VVGIMGKGRSKMKFLCYFFTILFIVIALCCWYIYQNLNRLSEIEKPVIYSKSIEFKNIEQTIYIKTKIWGLLGGHSCIFISSKDGNTPDKEKDIVFDRSGMYYKKQDPDSLLIFMTSMSYSEEKEIDMEIGFVKVKIRQFKASMKSKYENYYKDMGLFRVSCYDGID
jgi:hypothetical protein